MFLSLALTALTAAPAQGGDLKLTNVRMTIGELGGQCSSNKYLPGDIAFIGYEISGLTIEADGTTSYKMAMEVQDATGKAIFKQDPRDLKDFVPLRGVTIPARAFITIGLDQDPGNYTCNITVEDPKTKAKGTLSTKFEVLKRDFGVVAVYTTHDERGGLPGPTTGIVGQTLFIQFTVATFQRDAKTKQPNVEVELQILDEKGTPILNKPSTHVQNDKSPQQVDEKSGAVAMQPFAMFMSRPGKFTFRITANDKVSNKKSTYELPMNVLAPN